MKVHLIKKQTIEDYAEEHASGRGAFKLWLSALKRVEWEEPEDILTFFGSADLLLNGSSRVVFNIGGNKHRLICKYAFGDNEVHLYVCWIGTHAEYNELCKKNKQYSVHIY